MLNEKKFLNTHTAGIAARAVGFFIIAYTYYLNEMRFFVLLFERLITTTRTYTPAGSYKITLIRIIIIITISRWLFICYAAGRRKRVRRLIVSSFDK